MRSFFTAILWTFWSTATAMVGYHIHHSIFWSCLDWVFSILVWAKWLICHDVTLSVIRDTFSFFLQ
jgi:hypothetical protein